MATKKTVKKAAKKVVNKQEVFYAIDSNHDSDLGRRLDDLAEVDDVLEDWSFDENEVVTVYKMTVYKRYKKGSTYMEAN